VREYVERTGLPFSVVLDSDSGVSATYRIVGIPTHLFVDANGILREQRIGSMSKATIDKKLTGFFGLTKWNLAADWTDAGRGTRGPRTSAGRGHRPSPGPAPRSSD